MPTSAQGTNCVRALDRESSAYKIREGRGHGLAATVLSVPQATLTEINESGQEQACPLSFQG
jgi:hypothetical protein